MIRFNCDECNVINITIAIGILEMNCTINGLVNQQICLKTQYVVQYVD